MEKFKVIFFKRGLMQPKTKKIKNIQEAISFAEKQCTKNKTIYLGAFKKEIYVTDNFAHLKDFIFELDACEYDFYDADDLVLHIQEYSSFEDAYKVALDMREPHELCYNTKR